MDLQGVLEALRHQPFERFSISLADGRKVPLTHPEAVAVGRRRIVVVKPDDSWTVIEPLLIVSLARTARAARGEGRSYRCR